jgi:hypothetical protein
MGFGFQADEPRLEAPWSNGGLVSFRAGGQQVDMAPDEARLYALRLIKAADKAEEGD